MCILVAKAGISLVRELNLPENALWMTLAVAGGFMVAILSIALTGLLLGAAQRSVETLFSRSRTSRLESQVAKLSAEVESLKSGRSGDY